VRIGASVAGALTTENLAAALDEALNATVAARAATFARHLPRDGAMGAARRIVELVQK
jgi:hypothetical protein